MASPVVDDQFWFDQSKKLTETARESRDVAASKLQSFVGWAWTVFSAVTGFTITSAGRPFSTAQLLVVSTASVMLLIVYWLTTWAQMPKIIQFDPRSPTDIQHAYETDVKRRAKRLNVALGTCVLAAIFVGLSFAYMAPSKRDPTVTTAIVAAVKKINGNSILAITGSLHSANPVLARVLIVDSKGGPQEKFFLITPVDGKIQIALPLGATFESNMKLQAELNWTLADKTKMQAIPTIAMDR